MGFIRFAWQYFPGGPLLYEEVFPVEIAVSDTVPGRWSDMHEVTSEKVAVFRVAMNSLRAVDYTLLRAPKQMVNGMNYKFVCEAKVVAPGTEKFYAMIYICDAPDDPVSLIL